MYPKLHIFLLGFLTLFLNIEVGAQDDNTPVIWEQQLIEVEEGVYDLIMKGKIAPQWHVYSQYTDEGGSLPSEFIYHESEVAYDFIGETLESTTVTEYSDIFEVEETFFRDSLQFTQRVQLRSDTVDQIRVTLSYQVCKEVCIQVDKDFLFALNGKEVSISKPVQDKNSELLANALILPLKQKERLYQQTDTSELGTGNFGVIFGLGFLGGLIALLTPCVFPLIPLTVSFFTKQGAQKSKGVKNALLYGLSIVLIYVLLSLPFHLFDSVDGQILNSIATNSWVNLFFFAVFIFFAFSFFGYYELTLPSSWANRMDSLSNRAGGALGIFFMALTLAIVSFSCTGPILGSLLGSTALSEGDVALKLSVGMFGFGLALALPFALFALFPTWLQNLPKSGDWMTTVKVTLGFIELGLALKFLSNADLVSHWGILKREVFLIIWILLALGLALYLFGVFQKKINKISTGRKLFGLLSLSFAVYLTLGSFNVISLKGLSGFPPPDFYSLANQEFDCPLGLECYKDFEQGLAVARQSQKPIMLDFTGWACVNCRKMEEQVWSDPDIFSLLHEEFVIVSLYTDDRETLAENQQFVFKFPSGQTKEIRTIGQKWGTFQNANFGAISQPYYVLLSPELEVLESAVQNTDIPAYKAWLESGLARFNQ